MVSYRDVGMAAWVVLRCVWTHCCPITSLSGLWQQLWEEPCWVAFVAPSNPNSAAFEIPDSAAFEMLGGDASTPAWCSIGDVADLKTDLQRKYLYASSLGVWCQSRVWKWSHHPAKLNLSLEDVPMLLQEAAGSL